MSKNNIIANFSRYANMYDRLANIQKIAGERLIGIAPAEDFKRLNILEIGCGTGNFTLLLKKYFPASDISAFDVSCRMVDIAKKKIGQDIVFFVADAESDNIGIGQMDIIASNATFQWFENLESSIIRYAGMLKRDGILFFSIFGKNTFFQLNRVLSVLTGDKVSTASSEFLDETALRGILKKGFKQFYIEELIIEENYASMLELLKKIKYTGISGKNTGFIWNKKTISVAEDIYRQHFAAIYATYQIFLCRGDG